MTKFEFKGTKGPWTTDVIPRKIDGTTIIEILDSKEYYWVSRVSVMVAKDRGIKDAKLIASSPEMFEFINDIYDGLCDRSLEDGKENDDKLSIWERSVKSRAKELLTKATE